MTLKDLKELMREGSKNNNPVIIIYTLNQDYMQFSEDIKMSLHDLEELYNDHSITKNDSVFKYAFINPIDFIEIENNMIVVYFNRLY